MTFIPPSPSLLFFILSSVVAQLLLKASGLYAAEHQEFIGAWLLNPYLCAAIACYGISFICWIRTLRVLSLSSAYPWTALIYVLTPIVAVLLWQEQLSITYLVGMTCILCGIGITVKAGSR
ncbi:MAG: SMR family transporter [Betaproteobacteria bacterium]|nr:SMR family transporter [Betaproteobacteria bacterium]